MDLLRPLPNRLRLTGRLRRTILSRVRLTGHVPKILRRQRDDFVVRQVPRACYDDSVRRVVHGDARLPNLLRHRDKLLWCDFGAANAETGSGVMDYVRDARALTRSLLFPHSSDANLPSSVEVALRQYGESRSDNAVESVVTAILDHHVGALNFHKRQRI